MDEGPIDLASWRQQLDGESTPLLPPILFQTVPPTSEQEQSPSDYAIEHDGSTLVGADPNCVGPLAHAGKTGSPDAGPPKN
jgi:hypothetical protein